MMAALFTETAYAKINLALHVRQRRDDGYHDLETLFAFVDDGDRLTAQVADADRMTISGAFADGLSSGPDNLVLAALAALRAVPQGHRIPSLAIHLDKALPVAAGLGGGSADAGALIRLVHRVYLPMVGIDTLISATAPLGADVSACIVSETRMGKGTGTDLYPVEQDSTQGMPVLLVNPRIPLSTGAVFAQWDGVDRGSFSGTDVHAMMRNGRNDLEQPALALCPEIMDVLAVLRAQLPMLTRMSGSGATCFALFDDHAAMAAAATRISSDHPEWWTMTGRLR